MSYAVVEECSLDAQKEKAVRRVVELCCVTRAEAALLLLAYKWRVQNLTKAWFGDRAACCAKAGLVEPAQCKLGATGANAGGRTASLSCVLCGAWPKALVEAAANAAASATKSKPKTSNPKASKPKKPSSRRGLPAIMKQLKTLKKRAKRGDTAVTFSPPFDCGTIRIGYHVFLESIFYKNGATPREKT